MTKKKYSLLEHVPTFKLRSFANLYWYFLACNECAPVPQSLPTNMVAVAPCTTDTAISSVAGSECAIKCSVEGMKPINSAAVIQNADSYTMKCVSNVVKYYVVESSTLFQEVQKAELGTYIFFFCNVI